MICVLTIHDDNTQVSVLASEVVSHSPYEMSSRCFWDMRPVGAGSLFARARFARTFTLASKMTPFLEALGRPSPADVGCPSKSEEATTQQRPDAPRSEAWLLLLLRTRCCCALVCLCSQTSTPVPFINNGNQGVLVGTKRCAR